jgi:hypothetical protein
MCRWSSDWEAGRPLVHQVIRSFLTCGVTNFVVITIAPMLLGGILFIGMLLGGAIHENI